MIIIPVYATKELESIIMRCIATAHNITDDPLCIVDDASPHKINYSLWHHDLALWNQKNEGYTKAVNSGLKLAISHHHEKLIVANDDLVFDDGDLSWVSDIVPGVIVSPKTSDEGDGDMFGSLWGIHAETVATLGYLDELLPHFFSDTEYYHRAKRQGIKIIKREDIVVKHVGGATYNLSPNKEQLYVADKEAYDNKNMGK